MREIKFRGKRCDNGNWIYGSLIIDSEGLPMIHYYENKTTKQVRVKPKTVGQYTGLKDRSGNEIYEGDILENSTGRACQTVWHNGIAGFDWKPINDKGDATHFTPLQIHMCKWVGNIHESKNKL